MPLQCRGYGAYISYDGRELEVHKVKEKGQVVSCFIESEAGREFKVHWVDSKPPTHLSVEIKMDGRRMGVISHQKQSSRTSSGGFRVSIDAHCPYQFAPVPTTDDDGLPSAYTDDLGTIEVKLRRVASFFPMTFTPKTATRPGPVNEREGKGNGSPHCVSLGNKKAVKPQTTILRPRLIDDKPYAVFVFRYRPRAYLQARGIIPESVHRRQASPKRRRKRSPSRTSPLEEDASPIPPKRHRTSFETEDTPFTYTEESSQDGSMPPMDLEDGDNKETVVEVRLSSKENYSIPGIKNAQLKRESSPVIKRESPDSVKVERGSSPLISLPKRERSPGRRPRNTPLNDRTKRRPASQPLDERSPPVKRQRVKVEDSEDITLVGDPQDDEDEDSEHVKEVHLSSVDGYSVPGGWPTSLKREPSIKAECDDDVMEEEPSIKTEPLPNDVRITTGAPLAEPEDIKSEEEEDDDDGEETLVEIHLTSKDLQPPPRPSTDASPKREIKEEPLGD